MPYSKSNPPDRIKSLPKHAQDIWVAAFKSAWDTYDGDEEKCNMVAWSAVKESYEKNADGKWVVKASEEDSLGSIVYIVDVSNVQLKEKDDSLVSDIQIFKTGEFFNTDYGDFEITAKDLENIEQNFSEGKRPKAPTEMVVDYEHDSAHRVGPSPAAGWVRNVFRKGRNLLFATVEWTKKAAEMIKNGEYKFVSPEYHYNYVDKETKEKLGPTLLAVALTNRPFLKVCNQLF